MRSPIPVVLLVAALGGSLSSALEPAAVQVTAAEWGRFLPEGSGKTETLAYCGSCHDHSFIATARMSKEAWTRASEDMLSELGQDLASDAGTVGAYLGAHFGPAIPKFQVPLPINCASEPVLGVFVTRNKQLAEHIVTERRSGPFLDQANLQQRLASAGKDVEPLLRLLDFTQTCKSPATP
jgi:hypothetical protein